MLPATNTAPETFESFMERALHHPRNGYYSRNISAIGSRGDFTTVPQLSDTLAKSIAKWIRHSSRTHGTRNLIEIGPGLGTLASQVLQYLPPLLRFRSNLHLVDSSPTLRAQQEALLGKKATYHETIHSALEACEGSAIIWSNELVDAFPVRLFEKTPTAWQEVALDRQTSQEILLPPGPLPPSSLFDIPFPLGQRIEVHDSYHRWLRSWLPSWKNGAMLTIDYGDIAGNIYHRRPSGTLRAYLLQNRIEGPAVYENPGRQDITADVNFTDLALWSEPWLNSSPSQALSNFIQPHTKPRDTRLLEAATYFRILDQHPRKLHMENTA